MSRNRVLVPEAREGLNNFKMEAAREVELILKWLQWRFNC